MILILSFYYFFCGVDDALQPSSKKLIKDDGLKIPDLNDTNYVCSLVTK